MRQRFSLDQPLQMSRALESRVRHTGPSSEKRAFGPWSCSSNLRSMSSADPMTSVMFTVVPLVFPFRVAVVPLTTMREVGRYAAGPLEGSCSYGISLCYLHDG